jgi:hypothetical protein
MILQARQHVGEPGLGVDVVEPGGLCRPPDYAEWEQSARSAPCRFVEPCLKCTPGVRGERRAPFLPALAEAAHVGTGAGMDGVPVEPDQFGEAQACLSRGQQQRVVAAAEPCRLIGSGEDRLDLSGRRFGYASSGR